MNRSKLKFLRAPEKFIKRFHPEEFDTKPYRTEFDRDRDRILYSKAFRRLKGKTQVFWSGGSDYLRTRLTHTLEVSQIARIIAYNLNLNGTLTEAIALGHDLGHTPFGHVGERTLNQIMNNCETVSDFQNSMEITDKGFKHNWQGLRVVVDLEKIYGRPGLNLTNFTLWGILNHSNLCWSTCSNLKPRDQKQVGNENNCYILRNPKKCAQKDHGKFGLSFYSMYEPYVQIENNKNAWSFEGIIVGLADEISQRHHDMEDALYMGIIDTKELIERVEGCLGEYIHRSRASGNIHRKLLKKLSELQQTVIFIPYLSKLVVDFYTNLLISNSIENLRKFIDRYHITKREDFIAIYPDISEDDAKQVIAFPDDFQDKDREMQKFLKDRILNSYKAQQMDGKGRFIIRRLFKAYITNPRQLQDTTIVSVFRTYNREKIKEGDEYDKVKIGTLRDEIDSAENKSNARFQISLLRTICDFVAGMTDDYAFSIHEQLYG